MTEEQYQPLPKSARRNKMGLCLSGGGFRATLFHLGSLRRLNEIGLLSKLNTISSVSGGSILNGLLARVWPNLTPDADGVFTNFQAEVEDRIRLFCSMNIRSGPLLWQRLNPLKWKRLTIDGDSATNLLADTYRKYLVGDLTLQRLADIRDRGGPDLVFCATNYQTGVNFIFTPRVLGDWTIGYITGRDFYLANAVASSSAFPIAFPPLNLQLGVPPEEFRRGGLKNHRSYRELTKRILLTDGGVYDNLALEPVWKDHATIFCSDGGAPFDASAKPWSLLPFRLYRSNEIINNQARAVRKRWLISSYTRGVYNGCYWGVATEIADYEVDIAGYRGDMLTRISSMRTDLNSFSDGEQHLLINHGWALTKAAIERYFMCQIKAA